MTKKQIILLARLFILSCVVFIIAYYIGGTF